MLSVAEHAFALCEIFSNPTASEPMAAEWLRLAAGVYNVEIDLQAYEDTMMCGAAYDYYLERSRITSVMMQEITRFLFIWGSLEAFIGEIPNRRPKGPYIRKLLDIHESKATRLAHFDCNARHLACLVKQSDAFSILRGEFRPSYLAKMSTVFLVVSKLRNNLAHGVLELPDAPEWGGAPARELSIVACAQRLILLILQALAEQRFPLALVATYDREGYGTDALTCDVLPEAHLVPIRYEWASAPDSPKTLPALA